MLKYLTQKLRTQSINEENNGNEKIDGHDSGTESDDGEVDPLKEDMNEHEIESSVHLRPDMTSPDSTFLRPPHFLTYDQNSSEEELEVINGPMTGLIDARNGWPELQLPLTQETSPKRCSSTILEKRKRSLAHSSDDEVRQLLEQKQHQQQKLQHQQQISAPVNFRTSPPLEALKPHRGHIKRSTTPLVLTAESVSRYSHHHYHHHHHHNNHQQNHQQGSVGSSGRGSLGEISQLNASISGGNISLSSVSPLSVASNQSKPTSPITNLAAVMGRVSTTTTPLPALLSSSSSSISLSATTSTKTATNYCDNIFNCNNTNYYLENNSHQQQSVFNIPMVDVSPPTKKKSRHHHPASNQRSYRPCLDFDKMQQLKNRSVTTWRHSNEHGELSVFCW